jgi:hypothetical protein
MTYDWKNTESKILDVTHCTTCKKRLLVAEYMILIRYYPQTAKTRALFESTDGPTGRPDENWPNSDRLRDLD